jgi:methylisocitrate lyase
LSLSKKYHYDVWWTMVIGEGLLTSPGKLFREALLQEKPLQIVGAINAYAAMMAESVGYRALYLSGAGVANACYGLPDLGMTSLDNVVEEIRRITSVTKLPLLVDADTGWGHELNIAKTVQAFIKAGAAGLHIEDQVANKRCGHRPDKKIVDSEEMVARICAAVAAKTDPDFIIMARTDALASEGIDSAINRTKAYVAAGAEMIFAEAVTSLDEYRHFVKAMNVPVLANITEFGKTPLFTRDELATTGVSMILYPLSAFRAMNNAAMDIYETIRQQGTQKSVLARMQTRAELYQLLNYEAAERKLS